MSELAAGKSPGDYKNLMWYMTSEDGLKGSDHEKVPHMINFIKEWLNPKDGPPLPDVTVNQRKDALMKALRDMRTSQREFLGKIIKLL